MIASTLLSLLPYLVIWLAARHFYHTEASAQSKRLVVYLTIGSVMVVWLMPSLRLPAALIQLAICGYVIMYKQVVGRVVADEADQP